MPRWPDKKEEQPAQPDEAITVSGLPEDTHPDGKEDVVVSHETGLLWNRIDDLAFEIRTLNQQLADLKSLDSALKPDAEQESIQVQRRRDQIEIERALRLLASGMPRPQDDDSVQVITDCMMELFAMRKLNYDLMQLLTTGYQNGIAAIRRLTDR